jgi:hypothetical protein
MGDFPNKATQFTSENQPEGRGRPKGSLSVKTTLKQLLAQEIDWKDLEGKPARLQALDAMIGEQIRKAVKDGDTSAFTAIIDRLEGKPKQEIDQKTDSIQKVVVEYVESGQSKSDECVSPESTGDHTAGGESGRVAVE